MVKGQKKVVDIHKQLTFDGSETIINGTSDWTYEEEFGIRDGFRWSPDGNHIAFWQFDSSRVGEFTMINNTDSLYPKTITFRHAKVGTTNSACRVGVIDSSGGVPLWFDPSKVNSRDHYIARMEWAGSEEIVIQWLNRLQNIDFVMLCDIGTGEIRTVLTEKDEAWVSVQDITWIDSGRAWRKSIYQERYMGLPSDNEEGYTNGSPITHASKLEGNLLIVHGTGDDNVHYQSFERLVNELVKHNKIFTMMAYPNRSHGISEGENTTRHLFSLLTRYLLTNMPPGTKLQ